MGNSKDAPAGLIRDLVERDLMEKYHWTPQQIAQLPYKWVQRYYLIDRIRKDANDTRHQLEEFKKNPEKVISKASQPLKTKSGNNGLSSFGKVASTNSSKAVSRGSSSKDKK
jgi:hypothetical protein